MKKACRSIAASLTPPCAQRRREKPARLPADRDPGSRGDQKLERDGSYIVGFRYKCTGLHDPRARR